jgi:hypothetical protein
LPAPGEPGAEPPAVATGGLQASPVAAASALIAALLAMSSAVLLRRRRRARRVAAARVAARLAALGAERDPSSSPGPAPAWSVPTTDAGGPGMAEHARA